MAKKYKYELTVTFESEVPLKAVDSQLVQFENGLPYFADAKDEGESLNDSFVYGSAKAKLKAVPTKK